MKIMVRKNIQYLQNKKKEDTNTKMYSSYFIGIERTILITSRKR